MEMWGTGEVYPDDLTKIYDINKANQKNFLAFTALNQVIGSHLTPVSHLKIKILCNLSTHGTMLLTVSSLTIANISFSKGEKKPNHFSTD